MKNNLFSWIDIPCHFEALKKKVQFSLFEILYSHDNLEQLYAKNEQFNNAQKIISPQNHMSTLGDNMELKDNESVSQMSTVSNRKQRSVHLKIDEAQAPSQPSIFKRTQQQISNLSIKNIVQTESSNTGDRLNSQKIIPQNPIEQLNKFNNESLINKDEILLKEKLQSFVWDYENERTFLSYKKNAKKTFAGMNGMSHWQSIGMQPIISKLGLEEKLDLYREQLLDKYQNGVNLKESEKIFIINTSQLLVSNIDKKLFQGMLDFICQEDILKLEEKIAENVIFKYKTISEYLKSERNKYLREKADKAAKKIENTQTRNVSDVLKEEKEFKLKQREFKLQVERIKRHLERKSEQINYFVKLRRNIFVLHFINQLKKSIENKYFKKQQFKEEVPFIKNFAKRNYPPKNQKPMFTITKGQEKIPVIIKDSQKLYHPSSRLLVGLNELARIETIQQNGRNRNYLTDMTPAQQKQLEMQRATNSQFINKLQDTKKLIGSQPNFSEYYSNGPIETRDFKNKSIPQIKEKDMNVEGQIGERASYLQNKPQQWITKEIEENAAIIIQKCIKRHQQIKRFNHMKLIKREQQEKKVFEILKTWRDSKELISFIKSQTMKLATQKKLKLFHISKRKNSQISQSQPNSPRSNNSSICMNQQNKESVREKSKSSIVQKHGLKERKLSNIYVKQKKSSHDFNHRSDIHEKDRSDSISSINSKMSKHSYLGSMTSTKAGGTMTHDFSTYGVNQQGFKKSSIRSTNDISISYMMSHGKSVSDFQSPRSALFQSKQFIPTPTNKNNSENQQNFHHHQSTLKEFKGQIDEDVNMENEQLQQEIHQSSNSYDQNEEQFDKKSFKEQNNLIRKPSATGHQIKHQINKLKEGVKEFSKKHEELLIKQKKLFYGAKQGNLQIIKSSGFVFYPRDINSLDEKGNCPLYYVTKKGDQEFIDFLLKGEADVNMRCSEGNTPVHLAFELGKEKIIMDYLDKGGDLNVVNKHGQTPLAFASMKLLKMIGLEKGVTNVDYHKIGQRIDFDNNIIFHNTHNIIDMSNHVKELNSPITIIKKRKPKNPDEEIKQQEMYFQFASTSSTLDQNTYDRFSKGVKTLTKSQRTGDPVNQVQCFIEPQFRQTRRQTLSSLLELAEKMD